MLQMLSVKAQAFARANFAACSYSRVIGARELTPGPTATEQPQCGLHSGEARMEQGLVLH